MKQCHRCGSPWEKQGQPFAKAKCGVCGEYLHACKNCKHHNPLEYNQCNLAGSEWVSDREKANDCSWFEFAVGRNLNKKDTAARAREEFDKLFAAPSVTKQNAVG
ncbi:MAG: hypothetical protein NUW37_17660 [Planctomycetes bacterium]|nr:hypothetical protein [Planctomycetota bacterium]